jgi:hypothetical protein
MASRHVVLGLALAATIAASIWAGTQSDPVVEPVTRSQAGAATADRTSTRKDGAIVDRPLPPGVRAVAAADPGNRLEIGVRPEPASGGRDLFSAYSWQPPPPKPVQAKVVAADLPPPAAPAPTFTYIGRLQSGGRRSFLFLDGDRTQIVTIGDHIGDFRLDAAAGNSVTFTHLPTGLPVTVAAPAAGEQ